LARVQRIGTVLGMRGGLTAVAMTLGVLAYTGLAEAQCTKDSDCKAERICEQGTCTEPAVKSEPPPAPPAVVAPSAPAPPAPDGRARLDEPEDTRFFDEEKPRKVKKRISNPALMVTGIVLTAAGPTLWIVGVLSSSCRNDNSDSTSCGPGVTGAWLFLGGAALIGTGIPLIVIGAKRVPATRVAVAPWVSPRDAGLALRLEL
jgi:hypothetical protein